MRGLKSTDSEGEAYESHSEKPQKHKKQRQRLHEGWIIPHLSLQAARSTAVFVTCHFSGRTGPFLRGALAISMPTCPAQKNARQLTFTLPHPPRSWLLQPTPTKKFATLCLVPSHLDLSTSCSRADKPGLSQDSATMARNAIVSYESSIKVWHLSYQIQK